MSKLAIITDFDGTLMEQDVGDHLMKSLGVIEHPSVLEAGRRFVNKEIGSLEWIRAAYPLLKGRKQEVDRLLEQVHLRDGAQDFLAFCKERDIPVTILSDGMQYYIERLLQMNHVEVEEVIGNPIRYKGEVFEFDVQNDNPACKWCGCCKAGVVKRRKKEGYTIVYIGDGTSDYFGSSFADYVFARGSLMGHLEREGIGYYPFTSFYDVLGVIQPELERFEQGTAALRLNQSNTFCRF